MPDAADMVSNYTLQLGLRGLESGDIRANVQEMRENIGLLGAALSAFRFS
jgi:hypothetical protein